MGGFDARQVAEVRRALLSGLVIPAHPLALTADRRFDERRQVALTRYYCDAGAGGIAVGVHTTQFAIRDPAVGLLAPVLDLAIRAMREWRGDAIDRPLAIAGVCGGGAQALREAELAVSLGYDAGLLSLAALREAGNDAVLDHCRRVAEVIPLVGFYLQPAVGGRVLDRDFWRRFFDIEGVVAVKVAPFDRYRTLDVTTALGESGRRDIALYTGNDDAIVADLVTSFPGGEDGEPMRFSGGLLGQWAVWTKSAVDLLRRCRAAVDQRGSASGPVADRGRHADPEPLADAERAADPERPAVSGRAAHSGGTGSGRAADAGSAAGFARAADSKGAYSGSDAVLDLLSTGAELTDANAALFDPSHAFAGCIPGIHEVLRRQGLLAGRWCLDPHEELSPGQMEEIDRVLARYPHLTDDAFVGEGLDRWLR